MLQTRSWTWRKNRACGWGRWRRGRGLLDLGLDSLCLAVIVVRLEIRLGKDPFSEGADVALPATFGEFVGLYVNG